MAQSLEFAPDLLELADRVVQAVTDGGRLPFNGVHLRIEMDAIDWAAAMGGGQARTLPPHQPYCSWCCQQCCLSAVKCLAGVLCCPAPQAGCLALRAGALAALPEDHAQLRVQRHHATICRVWLAQLLHNRCGEGLVLGL